MLFILLLLTTAMYSMGSLKKNFHSPNTQEYYIFQRHMQGADYFHSETLLGASSFDHCIVTCEKLSDEPCQSISVNKTDVGVTCRYFSYHATDVEISAADEQNYYITKKKLKQVCEKMCEGKCGECRCLNACFFGQMDGARKYTCDCTQLIGERTSCAEHSSDPKFIDGALYLVNPDDTAHDIKVQCRQLDRDFIGKDVVYEPFRLGYHIYTEQNAPVKVWTGMDNEDECALYCYSHIEGGKILYNGWFLNYYNRKCYCYARAGDFYQSQSLYRATKAEITSNQISMLANLQDAIVFMERGSGGSTQNSIWEQRSFEDYVNGFSHSQNTWLGLENAARITAQATFDLRVDVSSTILADLVTTYYRDVKIVQSDATTFAITFASFYAAGGVRTYENLRDEQLVSGTLFSQCSDGGWWFCYGSSPTAPSISFGEISTADAIAIYLVYA